MRAVGYSIETAIADIIDNSLSAGATTIAIDYSMDVEIPYLSILDDGCGMSPTRAREAMRLAGIGANEIRADHDLGRFGLGLKTASLSQCRRLTVLTKDSHSTTGLVWDLDHIANSNDWSLIILDETEIRDITGHERLQALPTGTLIVWNGFDRISAQTQDVSTEFDAEMVRTRDHLALIFHQYLNGDHPYRKVQMSLNSNEISGFDPFLSSSKKTQVSPIERINVVDAAITVQSFTLPYLNELSERQRRLAQIPGQMRDSQGFYIYRGGRLVIWGTWFRLLPKSEGGKLARVKVEIPNSLDHLWSLDIKKSSAIPPVAVRDQLRRLADTLASPSKRVVDYRGRKVKGDEEIVRVWDVIVDRDTFRYEINREHPVLKQLVRDIDPGELRTLENALELIETYFPTQDLANRHSKDHVPAVSADDEEQLIRANLLVMWEAGGDTIGPISDFVEMLVAAEPWSRYKRTPEVLINWIADASNHENGIKNA